MGCLQQFLGRHWGLQLVSKKVCFDNVAETVPILVERGNFTIWHIKELGDCAGDRMLFGTVIRTIVGTVIGITISTIISTIIDTLGGEISSMYDLGMEVNRDGTISIDEEILDQALATDLGQGCIKYFVTLGGLFYQLNLYTRVVVF